MCSCSHLSVDVAQRSQQDGGAVRRAAGSLNALQQLLHRRLQLLLLRLHFNRQTLLMKHSQSLQGHMDTVETLSLLIHVHVHTHTQIDQR